jgi:hypothetical protein
MIVVIGVLAGASIFLGGVLAQLPSVLAAILLAAAVVGAALLASALAFGRVVLVLCAPLVAVGLSYDEFASSAQTLLLQSRGVGRVASVVAGALAAALILNSSPPEVVFAVVAVAVLGAAAATVGSRWYVTSAFTTLLAFLMLLNGHPNETTSKINERVGETILCVAAAYLAVWLIPTLQMRHNADNGASP